MKATFEVTDEKVVISIEEGTIQRAIATLLSHVPFDSSTGMSQVKVLDQKSRLHIPYQIMGAAGIPPDSRVVVTYDKTLDCIRIRRAEEVE